MSRTARILNMLLGIVAKPHKRDKFEVTPENVAYLAALVSVSEEVRGRCHLKHRIARVVSESPSAEGFSVDLHSNVSQASMSPNNQTPAQTPGHTPIPSPSSSTSTSAQTSPHAFPNQYTTQLHPQSMAVIPYTATPANRRQKSWDLLDQNAIAQARQAKQTQTQQMQGKDPKFWKSLDIDPQNFRPLFKTQRSSSMPTPKIQKSVEVGGGCSAGIGKDDDSNEIARSHKDRSSRVSVSNEDNVLLDPEVVTDFPTQALVLTVLATLVRNTTDENEMRILYEYLAEASVVFPKVFPVIHSLLDAKITSVLSLCHDQVILSAVQSIIHNMIACEDCSQQQLHYLQTFGFGGLWRFAGPFSKDMTGTTLLTGKYRQKGLVGGINQPIRDSHHGGLSTDPQVSSLNTVMKACCGLKAYEEKGRCDECQTNLDNAELFVNCLEAMVETCLPADEGELHELTQYPSTLSVSSTMNLSSSMSSLTLGSPTEKESSVDYNSAASDSSIRMRHGSASQLAKQRSFKCKSSKNGKNSH